MGTTSFSLSHILLFIYISKQTNKVWYYRGLDQRNEKIPRVFSLPALPRLCKLTFTRLLSKTPRHASVFTLDKSKQLQIIKWRGGQVRST